MHQSMAYLAGLSSCLFRVKLGPVGYQALSDLILKMVVMFPTLNKQMYVITSKQPGDSVPSDINMTVLLAWWHPGSSGALAVSRGPSVHYAHESSAPVTHSRPFCRSSSLSRHGGSFRASASMGGWNRVLGRMIKPYLLLPCWHSFGPEQPEKT